MMELWATLVADHRLTPEATVCALHLLAKGDGEHEVGQTEWQIVLANASDRRVRAALKRLEDVGLVERTNGGSRPDRYRLSLQKREDNHLSLQKREDNEVLLSQKRDDKPVYGHKNATSIPRARDAVPADVEAAVPAVSAREENSVDPKADRALDERFAGCRDSIRDALRFHVDPKFHYPFVMSLLAYIEQMNRLTDAQGATIPADTVPSLIAKTLNELGPEIAHADNPTRKVTANLHGIARRVNDRRPANPSPNGRSSTYTEEERNALAH